MNRLLTALLLCCLGICLQAKTWTTKNGQILEDGSPVYHIGTNMWYAADLLKTDPARFHAELRQLEKLGIRNLRILAVNDDTEALRNVLTELEKKGMSAVLYLNNSWEWSPEGYRYYLEKAGRGVQPTPADDGYETYVRAMSEFASNQGALDLFYGHIIKVVNALKDENAIFSWQICNEPRPFSRDPKKVEDFVSYIESSAALIKSIDPRHLVSTGSEGLIGCNGDDAQLHRRICSCKDIDYITVHIWPYNWQWVSKENLEKNVSVAIEETDAYLKEHTALGLELSKPVVIEEFGYPRDGFSFAKSSSVKARDSYYSHIFSKVTESASEGGVVAGCNFWAWSGLARQRAGHEFWQEGDDLCGDPFHEGQGLYGVYRSDRSTVKTIRKAVRAIRKASASAAH